MTELSLIALLRRFESARGLSLPEADTLAVRVQRIADRAAAFHAGQPCGRVHLVRSGLFKQLYVKKDGSEWIKSFAGPGDLFACPFSFAPGAPASFSSVAIGPGEVESVAFADVEALAARHPGWQQALRLGFQKLAELKIERERDLLMLSPAELYAQLCERAPELAAKVPQKDLAGYLGVTPVGLNRIVRRAREAVRT